MDDIVNPAGLRARGNRTRRLPYREQGVHIGCRNIAPGSVLHREEP